MFHIQFVVTFAANYANVYLPNAAAFQTAFSAALLSAPGGPDDVVIQSVTQGSIKVATLASFLPLSGCSQGSQAAVSTPCDTFLAALISAPSWIFSTQSTLSRLSVSVSNVVYGVSSLPPPPSSRSRSPSRTSNVLMALRLFRAEERCYRMTIALWSITGFITIAQLIVYGMMTRGAKKKPASPFFDQISYILMLLFAAPTISVVGLFADFKKGRKVEIFTNDDQVQKATAELNAIFAIELFLIVWYFIIMGYQFWKGCWPFVFGELKQEQECEAPECRAPSAGRACSARAVAGRDAYRRTRGRDVCCNPWPRVLLLCKTTKVNCTLYKNTKVVNW